MENPKEEPKQKCKYMKKVGCIKDICSCNIGPKQETLEEVAEKYANKKGDIPTTKLEDAIFKQGFIDGAKSNVAKAYWYNIFKQNL